MQKGPRDRREGWAWGGRGSRASSWSTESASRGRGNSHDPSTERGREGRRGLVQGSFSRSAESLTSMTLKCMCLSHPGLGIQGQISQVPAFQEPRAQGRDWPIPHTPTPHLGWRLELGSVPSSEMRHVGFPPATQPGGTRLGREVSSCGDLGVLGWKRPSLSSWDCRVEEAVG